jgi:transcriptional regulator with PAS, ATPase and Fis domain
MRDRLMAATFAAAALLCALLGAGREAAMGGPAPPPRGSLKEALQVFERDHVGRALARNRGHRSRTAGELGITRQALGEKIRRLGL